MPDVPDLGQLKAMRQEQARIAKMVEDARTQARAEIFNERMTRAFKGITPASVRVRLFKARKGED